MKCLLVSLIFCSTLFLSSAQFCINDQGAVYTLKVQDVESKETITANNSNSRLTPASLTKAVTTATALELLGPEFTYETKIGYTGNIVDGILIGDVIIKSVGDPTFGSRFFESTNPLLFFGRIKDELQNVGIQSIDGNVLVDSDEIGYSAPRLWEDMGNYYGASPMGFNWCDNIAVVTLSSSSVGSKCKVISVKPEIKPYGIQSKVIAADHSKDSAYVYGVKEISNWWIEGSIPHNRSQFKIKAALPNPRQSFVNELVNFLKEEGIEVKQNTSENLVNAPYNLFTYHSPKLSQIIKLINHKSNNLFADALLLTLAKTQEGKGNWDSGNEIVKSFWQNKIEFSKHFRLTDGSGLSPKNLISANGMVQMLTWMQNNSKYYKVYEESLAKGGESGTLKSVFKNQQLKGRIIGKSGSFEGVLGYCGYMNTISGKKAAFCIIANNYIIPTKQVRSDMDQWGTNIILNK